MTKSPNLERGEVSIVLGNETYLMRPTFDCLQRIEGGTGKSISTLYKRIVEEQAITLAELFVIVGEGIRGAGGTAPEQLGDLIAEEGIFPIAAQAAGLLTGAMVGPKNLKAPSVTNPKTSPVGGAGNK